MGVVISSLDMEGDGGDAVKPNLDVCVNVEWATVLRKINH